MCFCPAAHVFQQNRAELRHAMSNSLTDEERADLVKKLASFVDSKINLPYLNESEEQLLFQQVISALLSLATPSADGKLVHFHAGNNIIRRVLGN